MKKKYLTIVCLLIIGIQTGLSQVLPKVLDQNNQKIKEIAQKVDEAGWVFLKKEKKIAPDDIFVNYKEAFGLSKSDEMIKVKSKTDDLGLKHNTYQQYYKGLMVEHFTYLIHEKEGVPLMKIMIIVGFIQILASKIIGFTCYQRVVH